MDKISNINRLISKIDLLQASIKSMHTDYSTIVKDMRKTSEEPFLRPPTPSEKFNETPEYMKEKLKLLNNNLMNTPFRKSSIKILRKRKRKITKIEQNPVVVRVLKDMQVSHKKSMSFDAKCSYKPLPLLEKQIKSSFLIPKLNCNSTSALNPNFNQLKRDTSIANANKKKISFIISEYNKVYHSSVHYRRYIKESARSSTLKKNQQNSNSCFL